MLHLVQVPVSAVVPQEEAEYPEIIEQVRALINDEWDVEEVPPLLAIPVTERVGGEHVDRFYLHDGHHRFAAALAEGYDYVPVVVLPAMTRQEKLAWGRRVKEYRKLLGRAV